MVTLVGVERAILNVGSTSPWAWDLYCIDCIKWAKQQCLLTACWLWIQYNQLLKFLTLWLLSHEKL